MRPCAWPVFPSRSGPLRLAVLAAALLFAAPIIGPSRLHAAGAPLVHAAGDPLALAGAALEQGRLRRAVRYFLDAVEGRPGDPSLHRNLALAYYDLRLLDESLAAMQRAVALSPGEALYRMELGALLLAAGDTGAAREQLFAALERNPGLGEAYWYLGRLYLETGQAVLAARALDRAERLGVEAGWLRQRLPAGGPAGGGVVRDNGEPGAGHDATQERRDLPAGQERIVLRMLPVTDRQAGERLLAAITSGEILFEFAGNRPEVAAPVHNGGYAGAFVAAELDPAVVQALAGRPDLSPPLVVETAAQTLVVQRLAPFRPADWLPPAQPDAVTASQEAGGELLRTSVDPRKRRVYAAALRDRGRALALTRRLRREGLPAFCLYDPGKRFPYMVVGGEFGDDRQAVAARDRLAALGFADAFVSAVRGEE